MKTKLEKWIKQITVIMFFWSLFLVSAWVSPVMEEKSRKGYVFFIWGITISFCVLFWGRTKPDLKKAICENRNPIFISAVVILCRIPLFDHIQRWDAGQYYYQLGTACEKFDFSFRSFYDNFRLVAHPTLGASFFYAMGEFLDPREGKGVFAVILILTVAALLCVYQLLQDYWTDFNEKEALAATLMISFVPLFLGTCSYFNVDYLIFIFFIFFVYEEYKKRYILMFFWLCVLLMTKEPAVIVVAGYYMVLAFKVFFAGKTAITNRIRTFFWDSRIRVLLGGIVVYILYAVYQGSLFAWAGQTKIADTLKSAKNGSVKTNYFGVEWKYILCVLKQIFSLNFTWLLVGAAVCLSLYLWRKKTKIKLNDSAIALFGAAFAYIAFFCVYITSALYRYHVFTVQIITVLSLIIISHALREVDHRVSKTLFLVFAGIEILQTGYSIDPVSNLVFKKLDTGNGFILQTTNNENYFGDGLVYNAQYLGLDGILDKMFSEVGYSEKMQIINPGTQAAGTQLNGNGERYIVKWNRDSKKREMTDSDEIQSDLININIIGSEEIFGKLPYSYSGVKNADNLSDKGIVYFIPYYQEDEDEKLAELSELYYIGECVEIKKGQWKVRCYELTKKDDYEGFSLNDLGDGKSKTAYDDKETVTWNQVEMTENRDVIQKNDIVDVTCSAFYKGKEVPINYVGNYDNNRITMCIGSNLYLPELEQEMIGKRIGEQIEVNCKVPDHYPSAGKYQGKELTFVLEPLQIVGIAEDMETNRQEQVALQKESSAEEYAFRYWDIYENDDEVSAVLNDVDNYYHTYARKAGESFEEMLTQYFGISEEEYYKRIQKLSKMVLVKQEELNEE